MLKCYDRRRYAVILRSRGGNGTVLWVAAFYGERSESTAATSLFRNENGFSR
jgi:hypothetical protein